MKKSQLTQLIILLMMIALTQSSIAIAQDFDGGPAMGTEQDQDDGRNEDEDEDDFEHDDDGEMVNIDKLRFFYKAQFPKLYDNVNALVKEWERTGKVTKIMHHVIETFHEMSEIKEEEPQFFKEYRDVTGLELQSIFLGHEIRALKEKKADAKTKAAKTAELKVILTKLFTVKLAFEKREIERFKSRVKGMEERLKRRLEKKDRIIERRLDELTGEEDDITW